MLKIGKTLSVGTALVQQRPFDVDLAEAALASQ
jgi:hypothetical protein